MVDVLLFFIVVAYYKALRLWAFTVMGLLMLQLKMGLVCCCLKINKIIWAVSK